MSHVARWFERKFESSFPMELLPNLQARLRDVATTVVAQDRRSPEYLRGFLSSEVKTWSAAIKESGIQPQ